MADTQKITKRRATTEVIDCSRLDAAQLDEQIRARLVKIGLTDLVVPCMKEIKVLRHAL